MTRAWVYIAIAILAALIMLAAGAWLEWRDRNREAGDCTRYNPCPECQAEPPSQLDRWDRFR